MAVAERAERDLALEFVAQRPRLRSIAYRMLGSYFDAEDAVQETWLRLQRADTGVIENLEAWLTVVVSRVCVDQLRGRESRHEDLAAELPDDGSAGQYGGPEAAALHTEELGTAMLAVLETLGPLERLALVLHDMFGLSFDDIAPIVERTPAAARQLASRARRRVRGVDVTAERARQREAVSAFLKASRDGDFGMLLQLLDPEVELRSDAEVVAAAAAYSADGAPLLQSRLSGADAVARVFAGRAEQTQVAIIDGILGAAYAPARTPQAIYTFRFEGDRITRIDVIGAPDPLADLSVILE